MRFAICLTQVADPETIEIDPLSGEIDTERTLHIINPADAAALETVLQLRRETDTVLALSVGPVAVEAVLREALAVGADNVLRLWDEMRPTTRPIVSAILLAAALRAEGLPDLLFCGSRSLAGGSGKVPALLGEYLNWPVVTEVTQIRIEAARVYFQRRLERGAWAEGEVTMPAVLAIADHGLRLRYASLPGLMQAKRAMIPARDLPDLGLSPLDLNFPTATVRAATPPRPRPRSIFIPDSALSAEDRIGQILSAGVSRKAADIVEAPPEEAAAIIFAFLRDHGFLEETR
jgi:electron transfer flavoprotein beta subunit